MDYTTEIYEAHRDLSECNAAFLEFVKKNPASLVRANFNRFLLDKRFPYFKSQPWPTFVNKKKKMMMAEAAIKISDLIKCIIPRFFSYNVEKISSYFEIDRQMTENLLFGADDDFIKNLLGRGDFIITPTKEFNCLEFNMQANLGGWQLDVLEPLYFQIPVIAKFLNEYTPQINASHFFNHFFKHILDAFFKKHPRAGHRGEIEEINMAIAYPDPFPEIDSNTLLPQPNGFKQLLKQKHPNLKGDVFICGLNSLKIPTNFVMHNGRKIHILIEMLNGATPPFFMSLVKKGNLSLYNGPITRLMSNKFNLAFLSEHQDSNIFTPEEQATIKKHIPWTRKIGALDTPYLLSHRENLVLKSSEGIGGDEVFLGRTTTPVEWEQQINKAVGAKTWVVQEYIPSSCYLYQKGESNCEPHHLIWGLFVFGSAYAGGFIRMMPEKESHGIINTHQGAERSIIVEVEED